MCLAVIKRGQRRCRHRRRRRRRSTATGRPPAPVRPLRWRHSDDDVAAPDDKRHPLFFIFLPRSFSRSNCPQLKGRPSSFFDRIPDRRPPVAVVAGLISGQDDDDGRAASAVSAASAAVSAAAKSGDFHLSFLSNFFSCLRDYGKAEMPPLSEGRSVGRSGGG